MKLCAGTIDWHCLLPEGHVGAHDPGVLKGMAGPVPDWKDTRPLGMSDAPSNGDSQRRASDGRPSPRVARTPRSK